MEDQGHDCEITKIICLRQLDTLALMTLREPGACNFDVQKVLFDMDFRTLTYMRRIQSVPASMPCTVGPYTSINSSLRLTQSKIRFQPTNASGIAYDDVVDPSAGLEPRFVAGCAPIPAMAVCSRQSDTGTFELNFHDDRYLPF